MLPDGFTSITIGDTAGGTGTVDINTAAFTDPVTIASGTIKDNAGTDIDAGTSSVTLDGTVAPGQSPGILTVTGNFAFADNDTFQVEIGGTTAGSGAGFHDQVDVTGTVTIGNNVTLNTSAFDRGDTNLFTPAVGEQFVIINNDGSDAIVGNFDGLAEGAIINNFLGSGHNATITYQGGTNANDVVLTATASNNAPVVDLNGGPTGIDETTNFVEFFGPGGNPIAITDSLATVTDADGDPLASMTITAGGIQNGDAETLTVLAEVFELGTGTRQATNVLVNGSVSVDIDFNATSGVFTITRSGGGTIPLAEADLVVRSLVYDHDNDTPTAGNRTFAVVANDGTDDSATATATVIVTPTDDPPTITVTPVITDLDEDASTTPRIKVADISTFDPDGAAGSVRFYITDGGIDSDTSLFEIDGNELFLVAGATLDFESNPSLDILVNIDDDGVGSDPDDNDAYTLTINDVVIPPPSMPDLDALSVTGASDTDDITFVNKPRLSGTALAGATVELFDGATSLGTTVADGAGDWSIGVDPLADGVHSITATATVGAETSVASGALSLTIDTVAPAFPSVPDLVAASDSGDSSTDDITNDNTPAFDGTAEAGTTVEVFANGTSLGTTVTTGGSWSLTSGALADDTYGVSATATDVAGNVSGQTVIKHLEFNIDGDLPSSESDIVFFDSPPVTESSVFATSGGFLEQRTFSSDGDRVYVFPNASVTGGGLDSSKSTVMEARLQVLNLVTNPPQDDGGVVFQVMDGEYRYLALFTDGGVNIATPSGQDFVPVSNIFQTHTYRLESPGGSNTLNFLVDGVLVHTTTGLSTSLNGFDFGDAFAGSVNNADADWDYVRVSQFAAPSSLAVTIDTVGPDVAVEQASRQADPTNSSPINFGVVFSEDTTNFATGDVTVTGTAGATTEAVTGSGATYDVAVSGMTQGGTVIASVADGVAMDIAGNPNNASTSVDNVVTFGDAIYDFTAATFSTPELDVTHTNSVVQVVRSGNTSIATTVDVVLTGVSATAGDDFTAGPVTLNFAVGETTKVVPIQFLGDTIVELDETINLSFTNFSGTGQAGTTNATAVLTIADDDFAVLTIANATVDEGNIGGTMHLVFDVTLDNDVDAAFTVDYETQDGTATTADGDYTGIVTTALAFDGTAGEMEQIVVDVTGDLKVELDETLSVLLSNVQAGGRDIRLGGSGVVAEHSDDTDPTTEGWALVLGDPSQTVGPVTDDAGSGIDAWFYDDGSTDLGTGGSYSQIPTAGQVATAAIEGWSISTTNRVVTASAGVFPGPIVEYRDGTTSWLMRFDLDGNGDPTVRLSTGPNVGPEYTIVGGAGEYHEYELIFDPTSGTADLFVDGVEQISNYGDRASALSPFFRFGSGGSDPSGRVHFNSVDLTIGAATAAATGTITNDDIAEVTIAANDPDAAEPGGAGNDGQFTVSMTNPSDTDTEISYTVSGSADNGVDYTTLSGTVTIPANQTSALINVEVLDDFLLEGDETVTVTLDGVAGNPGITIGAQDSDTVTITSEDEGVWSISGDATVAEGSAASYTVSLSGEYGAGETASIDITLADVDTTSNDYANFVAAVQTAANANGAVTFDGVDTLTFAAVSDGDTMADLVISLATIADGLVEADEDYTIALANPAGSSGDVTVGSLPVVAPGSLVAHFQADGNALDTTGVNNGTLHNGVGFAPGVFGQAFDFNGVNTYVSAPDSPSLDLTSALTISMWLNPRSPGEGAGHTGALWKGNDIDSPFGQSYAFLWTPLSSTTARVDFRSSQGSSLKQTSTSALPLNDFVHVAATYDGSSMKIYVNGTLSNSTTNVPSSLPNTNFPLFIGANADGASPSIPPPGFAPYTRVFDGLIDDVRIYNAALGDLQVAALSTDLQGAATTTITSADTGTWSLSGDSDVNEGAAATYTVSLSGAFGADESASIDISLTDLDTTGADYANFVAAVQAAVTAYSGDGDVTFDGVDTITFTANSDGDEMDDLLISLGTNDDSLLEGPEGFRVDLANPGSTTGADVALGANTVTTTINDNETVSVVFDVASSNAAEAGGGHDVSVRLEAAAGVTLATGVTVTASVVDDGSGSADSGPDYDAFGTQTATFTAGAGNGATDMVTLNVKDDLLLEGNEDVDLLITSVDGPGASIGTQNTHEVTILDDETATVAFATSSSGTVEAGGEHDIDVLLSVSGGGFLAVNVTVDVVDVLSGTAGGADYTLIGTDLTFAAGSGDGDVRSATLRAAGDSRVEGVETVDLELQNLTGPSSVTPTAPTTHEVTIDDLNFATISFASATSNVAEDVAGGTHQVDVSIWMDVGDTLERPVSIDVVDLTTGSADDPDDYSFATQAVTFPVNSGPTTMPVILTVVNDGIVEFSETVDLVLQNLQDGTNAQVSVVAPGNHEVTILDNDNAAVTVEDVSATEGGGLEFTVTLDNAVQDAFDVNVGFTDLSATGASPLTAFPDDYNNTGVVLSFSGNAGEQRSFTVNTLGDAVVELNEDFTVNLSATNPLVDDSDTATGTIENDDSATVFISNPQFGVAESDTGDSAFFHVRLSHAVDTGVDVTFATSDDTATEADNDYIGQSGILNFSGAMADETILVEVPIIGDLKVELTERLFFDLLAVAADGRDVTLGDSHRDLNISNDDSATVSIDSVSQAETDSGQTAFQFDVTLSEQVDVAVNMQADTADGSATTADNDYQAVVAEAVSFVAAAPPGPQTQTVTVQVNGDNTVELTEIFDLVLSNLDANSRDVTFAGGLLTETGQGTIENDDFAPVANAGGPYVIDEGDSLNLDASFSTDADDGFAGLTFRWDVDGDGDFDENVFTATPTLTWAQLNALDIPINDGPDGPRTIRVGASAGVFNVAASGGGFNDVFFAKHDSAGSLVWAGAVGTTGDDHGRAMVLNDSGEVYFAFDFAGSRPAGTAVDFDPGPGAFTVLSKGSYDVGVVKLDNAGNFIWGRVLGGSGQDGPFEVALDEAGDVYVAGRFDGTFDADPGPGTFNLTTGAAVAPFVTKLDEVGNFQWAAQLNEGHAVAIEIDGDDVWIGGNSFGTNDYDPGPSTFNLTSSGADAFLWRLDTNGAFTTAEVIGGTSDDSTNGIAADGLGGLYALGTFEGSADLDPGTGTFNVTSSGGTDVFFTKLSTRSITVRNVEPDFEAGPGETIPASAAGAFSRTGIAFTDPGTLDVHPVQVDYDGGGVDQIINVPFQDREFDLSYNYAASGTYTVTVTLKDDDMGSLTDTFEVTVEAPTVEFTSATFQDGEGAGNSMVVTLIKTGDSQSDSVVQVNITAGSANGGAAATDDYDNLSFPLTVAFAEAEFIKTVVVPINQDNLVELDETIDFEVVGVSNVAIGTQDTATLTILDDDKATLSIDDVSEPENGVFEFTISSDKVASKDITVAVNTADIVGEAVAGSDYTAIVNHTATITAGTTSTTVTVTVGDDLIVEDNEDIEVNLSDARFDGVTDPTRLMIGDSQGIGTIENNDTAALTIDNESITEGTGAGTTTLTFDVSVNAAVEGGFDVAFSDLGIDTEGAADYSVTTVSPLSFAGAAGETQTISVDIIRDATVENDETFTVTLGAISNTSAEQIASITTGDSAIGTITNDDFLTVDFASASASDFEDVGGNLPQLVVTGEVEDAQSVEVNVSGGTAEATDYNDTALVTIAAGSYSSSVVNTNLSIVGDLLVEDDETIDLVLENGSAAVTLGAQTTHTYTILNDDSLTVEFASASASDFENVGGNLPQLLVTGEVEDAQSVEVNVTGGTAEATDYTNTALVNIAAGSYSSSLVNTNLSIVDDLLVEDDETVELTLQNGSAGVTLGAQTTHTYTIENDDTATFTIDDVTVNEGDGTLTFTISLNKALDIDVDVEVSYADGSAATTRSPIWKATTTFGQEPATIQFRQVAATIGSGPTAATTRSCRGAATTGSGHSLATTLW